MQRIALLICPILQASAVLAMMLAPAHAAEAPPPDPAARPICVQARRDTEYNARPIGQHDVLIRNAIGDRRAVRLSTTCIHIYPDALVAVHSTFNCVSMGDDVAVRTIDGRGETCKVARAAPFVEGSIEKPYR